MIYLTGDIHGCVQYVQTMVEKYSITANDVIVLLGDVGMNFYRDVRDRFCKEALNACGVPLLCIHGNHEMRPATIPTYRQTQWLGGTVYTEERYPNLHFAKDGEIYDLDGLKAIAIGGAYSVDKHYRLQTNIPWFADEQPSAEIKAQVEAKLAAVDWNIDLVLSHTCPHRYMPTEKFIPGVDQSQVDRRTERWLDKIEKKLRYQAWFCGHWHTDKRIDDMHFLYHEVDVLECTVGVMRLRTVEG